MLDDLKTREEAAKQRSKKAACALATGQWLLLLAALLGKAAVSLGIWHRKKVKK